ncbi:MAG: GAF domain-containing protein [Elusimicrobiota bacterium]
MNFPKFKDLFSLWFPMATPAASEENVVEDFTVLNAETDLYNENSRLIKSKNNEQNNVFQKIRFDNFIRLCTALPVFVVSVLLWWGGALNHIFAITITFILFSFVQFTACLFFLQTKKPKVLDTFLCSMDLVAMGTGIHLTGGMNSPLMFMFFIPFIIQAFHRNWKMIIFYGIGGIIVLSLVELFSLEPKSSFPILDFTARVFFHALTTTIAALGVYLLEKKEVGDAIGLSRLRLINRITQRLNHVQAYSDVLFTSREILDLLQSEWGNSYWFQFLLIEEDGFNLKNISSKKNSDWDILEQESYKVFVNSFENKILSIQKFEETLKTGEHFSILGSYQLFSITGSDNKPHGILVVGSKKTSAFSSEDNKFLQFIVKSIGLTLQRLYVFDELRKITEMESCAAAINLNSSRSINLVYSSIIEGILSVINADQACLMMWSNETQTLTPIEAKGPYAQKELEIKFPMGEGILNHVLKTGEVIFCNGVIEDKIYQSQKIPMKSFICLPLWNVRGKPIGVITAMKFIEEKGFSSTEIGVAATFAARCSVALENAINQPQKMAA